MLFFFIYQHWYCPQCLWTYLPFYFDYSTIAHSASERDHNWESANPTQEFLPVSAGNELCEHHRTHTSFWPSTTTLQYTLSPCTSTNQTSPKKFLKRTINARITKTFSTRRWGIFKTFLLGKMKICHHLHKKPESLPSRRLMMEQWRMSLPKEQNGEKAFAGSTNPTNTHRLGWAALVARSIFCQARRSKALP